MDEGEPPKVTRPPGALRRIGRAIGDAGLTIGIARGLTHGGGGGGKSKLDSRAALFDDGARDYEDRTARGGLLDRVPGWLVLLVVGTVVVAILVFTSFRY